MHKNTGMRRLGPMQRTFLTAAALAAVLTPLGCANPFETSVDNPNAVVEDALNNAAGATTISIIDWTTMRSRLLPSKSATSRLSILTKSSGSARRYARLE